MKLYENKVRKEDRELRSAMSTYTPGAMSAPYGYTSFNTSHENLIVSEIYVLITFMVLA